MATPEPPADPPVEDPDRYGDDLEDGVIVGWLSAEQLEALGFGDPPAE